MRCIINQRNGTDRHLHDAAAEPLKEMRRRTEKEPSVAKMFVHELISGNGCFNFDQSTKSNTLEGIFLAADDAALMEIVISLRDLLLHVKEEDEKSVDASRRMIADILVSAVRNRMKKNPVFSLSSSADTWLRKLISTFVELAYFKPRSNASRDMTPVPPVSKVSRAMFQSRLQSCLTSLLATKEGNAVNYPYTAVSTTRKETKSSKTFKLVLEADQEVDDLIQKAHKTLRTLSKEVLTYHLDDTAKN